MEVSTKNILYQFIEGQTHFGIARGAEMSLVLNELRYVALHSNSEHYLQACTTSGNKLLILYAKQPMV